MASTSSFCAPQKASNHDELFLQQSLIFSDTLKDLKKLRKQLYSAADFFEASYKKQNQKEIVEETLKDYAIKALLNTVDHLGSVAFKVNNLLDEKIDEVSETELQFTCLEQRVKSYQKFINQAGLSQQSSVITTPKHHKRYIFPEEEETTESFGKPTSSYHSGSLSTEEESYQVKSASQETTMEISHTLNAREMFFSPSQSPQPSLNQGNFSFTRILNNRKPERRTPSPLHFSLMHSGSLLKRSPSPNYSSANRRYLSEPRRSVSWYTNGEKRTSREIEQNSSKSKRLFQIFSLIFIFCIRFIEGVFMILCVSRVDNESGRPI